MSHQRGLIATFAGITLWGCGASPPSAPVIDDAGLIPAAEEARLNRELEDYFDQTGRAIVVATTTSLGGQSIESYATSMFNRLGIGDRRTNQGLLLLVAPHERTARIEVGRGLESTVTSSKAAKIMQQTITPRLREGDFVRGIEEGVDALVVTTECGLSDGVPALCPGKVGT